MSIAARTEQQETKEDNRSKNKTQKTIMMIELKLVVLCSTREKEGRKQQPATRMRTQQSSTKSKNNGSVE